MLAAEKVCYLDEESRRRHRPDNTVHNIVDTGIDWSMLMETGDSILLISKDRIIVEVNQTTCELHRKKRRELIGRPCSMLIAGDDLEIFKAVWNQLDDTGRWSGEMEALRGNFDSFPARITVNKKAGNPDASAWMVIHDMSEPVAMRKRLEQEKANRREMYQTLRNLMKSFEKERRGLESSICAKIEGLLLPALNKIENERCNDLRNSYLNILRMELLGLTKGFKRELEAPLLKLTRTEMRVCRFIQKGYTGKEIAATMNISFETIQVHRRNIRKKLGLTGRKVNLFAFLSSKPFLRSSTTA